MVPAISTQICYPQRLTTAMLDMMRESGAQAIELFAARFHFDYTDRALVRETAEWFRGNEVRPLLHAPLTADSEFSRHATPSLNLLDTDRGRRIAAMDEVKRALEIGEQIPAASCVLHLGTREDKWSEHTLDYALTAVEHLHAFCAPLGMRLLLENLRNQVATPAHLLEILTVGHFAGCGVCLDVAHLHLMEEPLEETFALLGSRIEELHLSDNHGPDGGRGDEHLWPASGTERLSLLTRGTLDWDQVYRLAATLPAGVPGVLEIADVQAGDHPARTAREVWAWAARAIEQREAELAPGVN